MAWPVLALMLGWIVLPIALSLVGAAIPMEPSKQSVQQTTSLYVAIAVLAIGWFAIGCVPIAIFLRHWSRLKPIFAILPWFLVTIAPIGSWAFETWTSSSARGAGDVTVFRIQGTYRRQTRMRALDGPAAGNKFVIDARVADAAQRGDTDDRAIRVGRVRRGRLGLWIASFAD